MTEIIKEDITHAEHMLAGAMTALRTATQALAGMVEQLRSREEAEGPGEISKGLREMNSALVLALGMEEKARAARAKQTGGVGQGALDLDAARAEIGFRLDRLRAAGTSGPVSGRAE